MRAAAQAGAVANLKGLTRETILARSIPNLRASGVIFRVSDLCRQTTARRDSW